MVCSESLTFNIIFQDSNGSRCQLPKQLRKANEMKTDFKVKKVQMPAQNALEEKGEEVTHRKFLSLSWDLVWVENPGKVVYKLIVAYMFAYDCVGINYVMCFFWWDSSIKEIKLRFGGDFEKRPRKDLVIGLLDFHMEFWVNLSSSFLRVSITMKVHSQMKKPVLGHVWRGKTTDHTNTVDGRNQEILPTSWGWSFIPRFTGVSAPSQVVQDFSHQQSHLFDFSSCRIGMTPAMLLWFSHASMPGLNQCIQILSFLKKTSVYE